MTQIRITQENREILKEKFNASVPTVSRALNFQGHTKKQREIRCYAMNQLNGKLV